MKIPAETLRLYAVTDSARPDEESLSAQLVPLLEGGVSCVQLRQKELPYDARLTLGRQLLPLCHRFGAPLIINDDVQLALACGADGVHLGQDDMDPSQARALIGEEMILGVTAHNVEEALAATAAGADYLGCGAVFGSTTKSNTIPLPLPELQHICAAVEIPVVAIGGIDGENILQLKGSGVAGVAVVSALFSAADKRAAALALRSLAEEVAVCTQP